MNTQDVQMLYEYDRWANARVLAAASALSAEQWTRDLGSSHRSVHGTLGHIVWGYWRWLGRWLERPPLGQSPLECGDLPAMRRRWREIEAEQQAFLARLTDADLGRRLTYENPPGTPWTYPLAWMLQHMVNHSSYHRGQVTAMLRQLGAAAVATDFLVFIDERPPPPAG